MQPTRHAEGRQAASGQARIRRACLTAIVLASSLGPITTHADAVKRRFVMMDVTGRFTADTIIDAIAQKATTCWVPNDPAFGGFVVAGKDLAADGKTVRLDFKPASSSQPRKAGRKTNGDKVDGRILKIHAVPTFSGGYAIFAEQSDGIDIIPSLQKSLSQVERSGVIAC